MAEIPINAGPNDYRSLLLEPTVGYATHVSTLSLTDLTGFGQYIKDVRGKICATAQNLNEPSFDAVAGMRIMSALQIREDIAQWVSPPKGRHRNSDRDCLQGDPECSIG